MPDETISLGDSIERRDHVNKSGSVKQRYTVTIRSDKLRFNLDEKSLGAGPAKAILDLIKERISAISERAAPNTIKAREVAARAVAKGKAWAVKRYSGGRTGAMAPNQSDRLFNDSGRFFKAMSARWVGEGTTGRWIINFAANRLSPGTLDGRHDGADAAVLAVWERLKGLVPELADMSKLLDSIPVRRALEQAHRASITLQKAGKTTWERAFEVAADVGEFVGELDSAIGGG